MNIESTAEDSEQVSRRVSLRTRRADGTPQALAVIRLLDGRAECGPHNVEFSSSI
jgi:hypothetical protein